MTDDIERTESPDVDPERQWALEVPTAYSNRFYVTVSPPIVRIAFGERDGANGEIRYRSAVAILGDDAIALVELISRFVRKKTEADADGTSSGDGSV
jgi:hypothetical protein